MASEAEPDARRAFERGVQLAADAGAWVLVTSSLYLVGALPGLAAVREDDTTALGKFPTEGSA
jgi:hypothetical protein